MSQAKKCPQCGRIVDLEARTCPGCQHFFRTTFDPDNPQVSERPVPTPLNAGADLPPPRTMLIDVPGLFRQIGRRNHAATRSSGMNNLFRILVLAVIIALIGFAVYHFVVPAILKPGIG